MVLGLLLVSLVWFAFVAIAAYAGALLALEVYFDPNKDSIFLADDDGPRNNRYRP
jgi:hypothetical protein